MKFNHKTINDICTTVYSGGTPNKKYDKYYKGGTIPWLNTGEIKFNRIRRTEKYITDAGLQESSAKWVPENTVIVAMYGATAARVAIAKIPLTTNQACCNLIIDKNKADYRYVYYWLVSQYDRLASLANGGAQQNLNAGHIKDYPIDIPELQTQKKIADFLWILDDKIELNNRINENLEQQLTAYYRELFVEQANPKWNLGTIADLGDVVGGGTPSKKRPEYYTQSGIAWITPKDLSNDHSKFISHGENDITELGLSQSSATLMPSGTVLFSSRAPIGYIAIADGDVTTNQGFKSIVPYEHIGSAFVYYFLKDNLSIIENMASGSTFKEISGSTMRVVPAIIPDSETISTFRERSDSMFVYQKSLEAENKQLKEIRDLLLPQLLSGSLDVSEVEV